MSDENNMANVNEWATYNLKAVVQQTGVKPDTLRAWERRYGLPKPQRTAGGHRIYSTEDIETLQWLLTKQAEGLSISRAVKLWQNLKASGENPLARNATSSNAYSRGNGAMEATAVASHTNKPTTIDSIRVGWIAACMDYNERQAEALLSEAFSCFSVEVVVVEVLQKGLAEIGNSWYAGTISVHQEHFASVLATRRIQALLSAVPAPTRAERIVTACAPEDEHIFSTLLLTLLLRRIGFDVVYLGSRVPTERLAATIQQTKPDLIIFSAQILNSAASLLEVAMIAERQGVPMAFGGLIFILIPEIRNRIAGHYLGNRLDQAPQMVSSLLQFPRKPQTVSELPVQYAETLQAFRNCSAAVMADAWSVPSAPIIPVGALEIASQTLTHNIIAGLMLGSLNFIGNNLNWVEGLLANHRLPSQYLHLFLHQYALALHKHMDATNGEIIFDWFTEIIESIDNAVSNN